MKILVTGGAGFIGSHTVVALHEAGYTPIIVDDFSNASRNTLDGIARIIGNAPICHEGSVCDSDFVRAVCSAEGTIDGIIHFAAYKAVGESIKKPLAYYENNLHGLITVLQAVQETQIPHFVFSSSATVYGDPEANPIKESAPRKPATNPYGNTKAIAEDIIRDVVDGGVHLQALSLRYFNPIGAHASGYIGELPQDVPANLVPYLTQAAHGKREMLTIFGDDYDTPDGTGIRDFIHVVDLAQAHVDALDYLKNQHTESFYKFFNVGTGSGISVRELIDTFEEVTGVTVPHRIGPRRAGDIAACWADVTKINTQIGWRAQKTLSDALRDAWTWEQTVKQ